MGEPHPDLTRPPTHLSITSHLSHTLPLKHLCNWPPLYPLLLAMQISPSAASSFLREGCVWCPRSQGVKVLGKWCVSPVCHRKLSTPLQWPKAWSQVVGHFPPPRPHCSCPFLSTGTPSNMARLLLFIFITLQPGDRAFSQELEGLGGGRMGEDGHRCPRGADWVGAESRGSLYKAETQWTPPVCSSLRITHWEGHSPASIPELFSSQWKLVTQLSSTLCETLWTAASRLLCPWDSPGKNTGEGCQSLLQGIFPTWGLNMSLPHCRWIFNCLSHRGSLFLPSHLPNKLKSKEPVERAWRKGSDFF